MDEPRPAFGRPEVHMFWWGDLSPLEMLCMASFASRGVEVNLWQYPDTVGNAPQYIRCRDANEVLDESRVFRYESGLGKGSISAFSNLFRYALLLERGGWYADADVVLLAETLPDTQLFFAFEGAPRVINPAVTRMPAGHPVVAYCENTIAAMSPSRLKRLRWGQIGPKLMTRAVRRAGLLGAAQSPQTAFPISAERAIDLYDPAQRERCDTATRGAAFLHLWNEVLRQSMIDKQLAPPDGSFLASLVAGVGQPVPFAGTYPAAVIPALRQLGEARRMVARRELQPLLRLGTYLRSRG